MGGGGGGQTAGAGVAIGVAAWAGDVLHPPHVQAAVAGSGGHALTLLTRRAGGYSASLLQMGIRY